MPSPRRHLQLAQIATLTTLAALTLGCSDPAADATATPAASGPPPARVRVEAADDEPLLERFVFSGEVRATRYAEFAPSVSGPIREVAVRVGDEVEARALLFSVDPRIARSDFDAARAAVASSEVEQALAAQEAQAMRNAQGAERGSVAALEVERASARLDALARAREARDAELRRARTSLSDHRVRAPFAGQVAEVRVDVGDWADAGQVAVVLIDDSTLEVHVGVSADLVGELNEGTRVALRLGDRTTPAHVAAVVRALDPESGALPVRLVADERPAWLLPGRWVDVEIDIPRAGGVRVSRDALVRTPAGVRVMRVADGAGAPVPVEVLATNDRYALVRPLGDASLAPGDRVVTRGNERLRPGQPLSIEESPDSAGAGEATAPADSAEADDPPSADEE